jgi:predicted CoA-binding protein
MTASTPPHATRAQISDFLTHKRIAAIGVSRDAKSFSRSLTTLFKTKGYEVIPVNPAAMEIDGQPSFANIQDVQPPVDTAIVLTPPETSEQVVRDCAKSGVKRVWLYGPGNAKAANSSAVTFCHEHGMDVIPGECPFMFIGSWPHKMHGVVNRLVGIYPR